VAFIFAGILGLNRSMAMEKEEGCLQGLLLTPTDRGALYLGKMLANLIFLAILEVIILAVFALFFNYGFGGRLGPVALVTALGSIGFIAVGTLFAAIAVQTRYQEVLLPILLIPLVSPVLIGAVKATAALTAGGGLAGIAFWLKFLATFDAVFVIVCFLGFEYVVQE
jgi:heme exporter protein B